MAKLQKNKYGIIQTNNTFKIKGIVFGTQGKNFYTEDKNKRTLSFGVNINDHKPLYCRLQGFTKTNVYYSNNDKTNPQTIQVSWANRMKAPKAGFEIIGMKLGLEIDEAGKNIVRTMTEYDAAQYLSKTLHDGDSITVIGEIEYYIGSDGEVKKNYVPKQLYLERESIDFTDVNFKEKAIFSQDLVFLDLEKELDENGKQTGRVLMHGYDVSYQNVCKVKFVLAGAPLQNVNSVKKTLKPFNAITVSGYVNVNMNTDTVNTSYSWGKPNELSSKRINAPMVVELTVDYIDEAINEDRYDEQAVLIAIKQINSDKEARKNFGENSRVNLNVEVDDVDTKTDVNTEDDFDIEEEW